MPRQVRPERPQGYEAGHSDLRVHPGGEYEVPGGDADDQIYPTRVVWLEQAEGGESRANYKQQRHVGLERERDVQPYEGDPQAAQGNIRRGQS